MSVPAPDPSGPSDRRDGSLVTVNIGIDNITVGTLRWLLAIADATGMSDSERIWPSYDEQWTDVINGLELYVRGDDLPKIGGVR